MPDISVVIPCLNEEATLGACIEKCLDAFKRLGRSGEIVVCDNASTDASAQVAARSGARVVFEPRRGYGRALITGLKAAQGRCLVMGDADNTYDFSEIPALIRELQKGADLVMGNRLAAPPAKGAMPWMNRHVGTPALTACLRVLFGCGAGDSQCGMRAMTREAFQAMKLSCGGMELTSEMLIKAALCRLKVAEVPISYSRTAGRKPHLRPWRDGWRNVAVILRLWPAYLFRSRTASTIDNH